MVAQGTLFYVQSPPILAIPRTCCRIHAIVRRNFEETPQLRRQGHFLGTSYFSTNVAGLLELLQVAMKACPYRADFYKKLAADPDGGPSVDDEKLNVELDKWLGSLNTIIIRLQTFYEKGGHDKGF